MFRRVIIIALFGLYPPPIVIAQTPCSNQTERFTECTIQRNVTFDESSVDVTACTECFIDFAFSTDTTPLSCTEGTVAVCSLLKSNCYDSCFPKVSDCQDEIEDFYACTYGLGYTTSGCEVECDDFVASPVVVPVASPISSPMAISPASPTVSPITVPVASPMSSPITIDASSPTVRPTPAISPTDPTFSPTTGTPTSVPMSPISGGQTIPTINPSNNFFGDCYDELISSTNCIEQQNVEYDYENMNEEACTRCFTDNKFYENYNSQASCNDATNFICDYFSSCFDECFPQTTKCETELTDYYVCFFGLVFAPPDCTVQCDGLTSSQSGSNVNNNGTSYATPTMNLSTVTTLSMMMMMMTMMTLRVMIGI